MEAPRNDGQTLPADAGTPQQTAAQTIGLIAAIAVLTILQAIATDFLIREILAGL